MPTSVTRPITVSCLAIVVSAFATSSAVAQDIPRVTEAAMAINAANTLLRNGDLDAAIDAYRRIVPADTQRDQLNYNLAVAEYRTGNLDTAEQLFKKVAGSSATAVASDSLYNLGNCRYANALQVAEQDKPAAIEHLRQAICHYRGSLRGNPNNADARANIELAGELIRELEEEQTQEQQEQDQQKQEQQEQQDQDDSQQEEQQQQPDSQQSESDSDEQQPQSQDQQSDSEDADSQDSEPASSGSDEQQNDESQDEQPADQQAQQEDQQSSGAESQSTEQKPSEQQSQSPTSNTDQTQPQNKQQESRDQRQSEGETAEDESQSQNEPPPTGDLTTAGEQDENTQPAGPVGIAESNAKDDLMTREEALKMLQAVRDRDMLRRLRQQQQERSRHVPVDRDW